MTGIVSYAAPWAIFSMSWDRQEGNRLAVGSFIGGYSNRVRILAMREEGFMVRGELEHPYPATCVKWGKVDGADVLATAGDYLRIWRVNDAEESVELSVKLDNNAKSEFCAPLTAMDWNATVPSMVGTASIDTICTIWDLNSQSMTTQLIAHDKEVFDMAFAPRGADVFASVGADGSMRMFDLRALDHSTILFECPEALLRVAWNAQDPNYLATFAQDSPVCVVIDVRVPSIPCAQLRGHTGAVNSLAWAPHSAAHLATASEDHRVLVWDLSSLPQSALSPVMSYTSPAAINSMAWNTSRHDKVAISLANNSLQVLNV